MTRKKLLTAKLFLLIGILFVLLFATFGSLRFLSWGQGWRFSSGNDGWGKFSAQSQTGPIESFTGVERIVVDTASLSVQVYEGDVDTVTVQDNSWHWGLGTAVENTLTQSDGTLTFRQPASYSFLFSQRGGNVTIQVPRGTLLSYDIYSAGGSIHHEAPSTGELLLRSASGSIRALGSGESVTANSLSGSVRVEGSFATVDAQSTSGSVTVSEATEQVLAKSVSGSVKVLSPAEIVEVRSTSGSVKVTAGPTTREVRCQSTSGSVKIQLEDVPGYTMTYSATSGSVRDEYHSERYERSGTARWGDGSLLISASSTSGSITLGNWD